MWHAEHVLEALSTLGFHEYIDDVKAVHREYKEQASVSYGISDVRRILPSSCVVCSSSCTVCVGAETSSPWQEQAGKTWHSRGRVATATTAIV